MRLLLTLLTVALVAATPFRIHDDTAGIGELHRLIQRRFLDGGDFGMMRVVPRIYHGIRSFAPENEAERTVIGRLKSDGYEVALFLAGRGVLAEPWPLLDHRRGVQGPAFLTPVGSGLPDAASLREEGRLAMARFRQGGGYDSDRDGWKVAVRPMRATDEKCVGCHVAQGAAGLKVGDALGAALYVYRRK
jgi:hypothetical protein